MKSPGSPFARLQAAALGGAVAAFVVAFAVRWLTYTGLAGDDHWSLWTAATFLKGDLPFRDFVDVGDPLYWGMSAVAQYLTGYRVVGEVVLGTSLIAFAVALSFHLVRQASGSMAIASILATLALILITGTELYSYPKIFVYPLGLWLCWRYIDKPTLVRALVLAAGVVIAWGYRHDHGVYVGVGAAAAVLATHWNAGLRPVGKAWMRFGAVLLLLMSPYLLLIQVNEGIIPYIQQRLRIAQKLDAAGRGRVWFSPDLSAPSYWVRINPPASARVVVDWKPGVTAETRSTLERQYSLTKGGGPKQRLYDYFLTDISRDNLTALIGDARIVDRRGISTSFREMADGSKALSDVVTTEKPEPDAPPGALAHVQLQWTPALDDAELVRLERKYRLLDPTPNRNKWEYILTDVSTANIRAIVEDPHVYDTGMLEREAFRPMEESWIARLRRSVPLFRVSIAPRYWHPVNAAVLMYYASYAAPFVILAMLAADRLRGRTREGMANVGAKMFAAAMMMIVANQALLRKTGYFADHADVAIVLGGFVLAAALGRRPSRSFASAMRAAGVSAALVVLTIATFTWISPDTILSASGLTDGLHGAWDKAVRSFREYSASPPIDGYAPPGTTGDRGLLRYIYECTRSDDRIWLLTETYAVPYYTERRVVGHIYWGMGFLATPEYQRRTIERIDKEQVPFILSFGGSRPLEYLEAYDLVHAYAEKRYVTRYAVPEDRTERGLTIWMLTDGRRKPTGTYEFLGLPCFK